MSINDWQRLDSRRYPLLMDLTVPLLSELFDSIPLGVVVLDATGRVVVYNRAEEQLAHRRRQEVIGADFFIEVAPCMNVQELAGAFREKIGRGRLDVNVEFSFPFPFLNEPRDVKLRMLSLEVSAVPYAFLTIEDVSMERSIDRMKQTLNDLLVHDLKNPLAAVIANFGFLRDLDSVRDNRDAAEAIADGIEAAERVQGMLVNLLDVTRLETNSLPLRREVVDLHGLVTTVVRGAEAQARARGAQISAGAGEVQASADREVLRRALENLVDNALRHAKRVEVSVARRGDEAVLCVSDDGHGIPAAVRERIFEKYAQLVGPTAAITASHNRGLGLTFVRLAARAHGGEARVECPPGGGTRFEIALPLAPPSREAISEKPSSAP